MRTYFKDGRHKETKSDLDNLVDQNLRRMAEKIVEIGNLADPSVKEFPNDSTEAAKVLLERVLLPEPDYRTSNGILNAYSDELDFVASECVLASRGLQSAKNPFTELKQYKQVRIHRKFIKPGRIRHRKGGWMFELISNIHGITGEIERVARERTRVHLKRIYAAIEALHLVDRHKQRIYVPK